MGIKDKAIKALTDVLTVDYLRLEEDDGVTGFVVSPQFRGMSMMDRQRAIDNALVDSPEPLTAGEIRQILMIAGLTPEEYENVGARVRVHRVRELEGGEVEVLLHGGHSDAEYVRGALGNQKNVKTTNPTQVPGAVGVLMSFKATRTRPPKLNKAGVVRILSNDKYIQLMPNA